LPAPFAESQSGEVRAPLLISCLVLAAVEPPLRLAEIFNPELHRLAARRIVLEGELAALGTPVVGQTAEQFGYQHQRLDSPPINPAWVQIDLGSPQPLGWIALVPAQLDWQSVDRPAYGFPRRFRIDLADEPEFLAPAVVADFTESDFPNPGVAPLAVHLPTPRTARYVRVTVTKFALENAQYFFALSEILALSGNRNVAIGRPVSVSSRYEILPRWSAANLVDGLTPLGPPIRRELIPYDGLFSDAPPDGSDPYMQIDLGAPRELDEIRIHPVHARIGADVPGFLFPKGFRIETSSDPGFGEPALLVEARDFPNPGNNPITIPTPRRTARVVRFTMHDPESQRRRFGLSEIEIYSGGENIAPTAPATRTPDRSSFSSAWPDSALNDGFASYGRIMELPAWLESWSRRSILHGEITDLARDETDAVQLATRRGWRALALVSAALVVLAIAFVTHSRRRRVREIEQLRLRLARDLHDEIGSNLASLAVTGELAAASAAPEAREDWHEVQRVSRESMDSMREVLWVLGAREEAGLDLATRLDRTAQRMLARQEIVWSAAPENPPPSWTADARREVFLFFKEALANIARHANARRVELRAGTRARNYELEIRDDGRGFDAAKVPPGVGLKSLHERARTLRARFILDSAPARGTRITLSIPL